jgi:NIPSNAP
MKMLVWAGMVGLCAVGWLCLADRPVRGEIKVENRVFELRTYYAAPGKMADLHARFRDHTCKLFEKHGMTIVGFWSPDNAADAQKKLIYILAFPSKEAKDKAWKNFQADADWQTARADSEKNGKLVDKVESVMMNPTDYSAMH